VEVALPLNLNSNFGLPPPSWLLLIDDSDFSLFYLQPLHDRADLRYDDSRVFHLAAYVGAYLSDER
jgi:hypothetical protein